MGKENEPLYAAQNSPSMNFRNHSPINAEMVRNKRFKKDEDGWRRIDISSKIFYNVILTKEGESISIS